MAHLVIGWELGHGMGHLMPLRMISEALLAHGHRLTFLVRDPAAAQKALAGLPVQWLQAPLIPYHPWELGRTDCYADLLANIGLGNPERLAAAVDGWRALFAALRPDAALLEFAPSAMLACHLDRLPFAIQGNGFFCPPPHQQPFGVLNPQQPVAAREAAERQLLDVFNTLLAQSGTAALAGLHELYALARCEVLTTFAELDHFTGRDSAHYSGAWLPHQEARATWPAGNGPRIFAYLMPRPGMEHLLQMLGRSGLPTLVYGAGMGASVRARFATPTCQFLDGLVDVQQLAAEADLGIFHGAHSTTAAFLLAGKPSLQVPLYMEQLLFARRVRALGAAEIATLDQPELMAAALNRLVTSNAGRQGAAAFAARYRDFDAQAAIAAAADRVIASLL